MLPPIQTKPSISPVADSPYFFLYTAGCEVSMHRAYPILLIGLLISSAAPGQETPKPAASNLKTEKCSVAGMVVRKGSNEPIHFARITLTSDADHQKTLHGTTAADGIFTFKDIPPGPHHLPVPPNLHPTKPPDPNPPHHPT